MSVIATARYVGKTTKDPDSILFYRIDWTDWLEGDSIYGNVWSVTGGLVIVPGSASVVGNVVRVKISGGTLGTLATLTSRMTSTGFETEDATIALRIVSH